MIIDEKLNIGNSCRLIANYISDMQPDVAIEYTEYSTNHWNSDTETSINIDKNKAIEIIEFLKKHFDV